MENTEYVVERYKYKARHKETSILYNRCPLS
jgi:hypothetical protein